MDKVARTDLSTLMGDLNAGVFEQQLNTAISDVAANVVTHGRKGGGRLRRPQRTAAS